jgi:hypothetical protein
MQSLPRLSKMWQDLKQLPQLPMQHVKVCSREWQAAHCRLSWNARRSLRTPMVTELLLARLSGHSRPVSSCICFRDILRCHVTFLLVYYELASDQFLHFGFLGTGYLCSVRILSLPQASGGTTCKIRFRFNYDCDFVYRSFQNWRSPPPLCWLDVSGARGLWRRLNHSTGMVVLIFYFIY